MTRLVAIDLDGTLLSTGGVLTDRSAEAIHDAATAGVRIVLATGRPPHMVTPFASLLAGAVTHVVATNGSLIATFPATPDDQPELLHLLDFEIERATAVVETLRTHSDGFGFAMATDAGFAAEHGFAARMPADLTDTPVDDVLALGGTRAFKLFAYHETRSVHDLIEELPPIVNGHDHPEPFTVAHMGADAVEIGPASIDKAAGVRWLCDQLGVDRAEVMAFGDEWNDITLLQWAGVGVAMENADERVKAVADRIAPPNTDDGVAAVLTGLVESLGA